MVRPSCARAAPESTPRIHHKGANERRYSWQPAQHASNREKESRNLRTAYRGSCRQPRQVQWHRLLSVLPVLRFSFQNSLFLRQPQPLISYSIHHKLPYHHRNSIELLGESTCRNATPTRLDAVTHTTEIQVSIIIVSLFTALMTNRLTNCPPVSPKN